MKDFKEVRSDLIDMLEDLDDRLSTITDKVVCLHCGKVVKKQPSSETSFSMECIDCYNKKQSEE